MTKNVFDHHCQIQQKSVGVGWTHVGLLKKLAGPLNLKKLKLCSAAAHYKYGAGKGSMRVCIDCMGTREASTPGLSFAKILKNAEKSGRFLHFQTLPVRILQ